MINCTPGVVPYISPDGLTIGVIFPSSDKVVSGPDLVNRINITVGHLNRLKAQKNAVEFFSVFERYKLLQSAANVMLKIKPPNRDRGTYDAPITREKVSEYTRGLFTLLSCALNWWAW